MTKQWARIVNRVSKSTSWTRRLYFRNRYERVVAGQRRNNGTYAIDIDCNTGMFAQLTWCLFIFQHCERHGLRPLIRLSSPHYARHSGDDWLEDFFASRSQETAGIGQRHDQELAFTTISDIDELGLSALPRPPLTIADGHRLFNKYLTVRREIQDYVNGFVTTHFAEGRTLGLHFRGTDKTAEATPISPERCIEIARRYMEYSGNVDAIFVSSDEQSFVELVARRIQTARVVWHEDTIRSRDGSAIHIQSDNGDNYAKGFEAVVNSLLLSRCHVLMRTASFLSAWSSIFNPALPVVMLNRPIDGKLWFPDREILGDAVSLCLPAAPVRRVAIAGPRFEAGDST
jgi:hypothetical protein